MELYKGSVEKLVGKIVILDNGVIGRVKEVDDGGEMKIESYLIDGLGTSYTVSELAEYPAVILEPEEADELFQKPLAAMRSAGMLKEVVNA